MSNIIKNDNDLLLLNDILNYLNNNSINSSFLESNIKYLLPKMDGELLIDLNIKEKGGSYPMFIPNNKSIILCVDKIEKWLDVNIKSFVGDSKIKNLNKLRNYLFIFMISHEIEHSYQYLIGEEIINSKNNVLLNAYKWLFDLLNPKEYIIPRPILEFRQKLSLLLYKLNENYYLLERNANIESIDLICDLARYNGDDDIYNLFNSMRNIFCCCGYQNNNKGSIYNTYKKILMYDKYKKFDEEILLTDEERIRYGFSINDNLREKLLKKIRN